MKLIRSGKTSASVFNDRMIPMAEMRAEPQSMISIPFIKEYTRMAYALFFNMNQILYMFWNKVAPKGRFYVIRWKDLFQVPFRFLPD